MNDDKQLKGRSIIENKFYLHYIAYNLQVIRVKSITYTTNKEKCYTLYVQYTTSTAPNFTWFSMESNQCRTDGCNDYLITFPSCLFFIVSTKPFMSFHVLWSKSSGYVSRTLWHSSFRPALFSMKQSANAVSTMFCSSKGKGRLGLVSVFLGLFVLPFPSSVAFLIFPKGEEERPDYTLNLNFLF